MCPHIVDKLGRPTDLVLRELEWHLCSLACDWAANLADPERQGEIVHEYHSTMAKLYSFGWDGTVDLECELPDELMPEEYRRRNPKPPGGLWRTALKTDGK
jgi:hypothetical protein